MPTNLLLSHVNKPSPTVTCPYNKPSPTVTCPYNKPPTVTCPYNKPSPTVTCSLPLSHVLKHLSPIVVHYSRLKLTQAIRMSTMISSPSIAASISPVLLVWVSLIHTAREKRHTCDTVNRGVGVARPTVAQYRHLPPTGAGPPSGDLGEWLT